MEMTTDKYELTREFITTESGIKLYRIKALRDFKDINKGTLGGYVQHIDNLTQLGNAWIHRGAQVFGDARVYGNAQVFGAAEVYGSAQVYGDARVYGNTSTFICYTLSQPKYDITITNDYIFIGCQGHSWEYWNEHIDEIGRSYSYSTREIKETKDLIRIVKAQIIRQLEKMEVDK